MAEHFRFFDSVDGEDERYYTADEFAEYFRNFLSNGVFSGYELGLRVTCSGNDMNVEIEPGYAFINGYMYKIDDSKHKLKIETADIQFNRIDRVVVRLDKKLENRYIKAFILKGEPLEEPIPPPITRNENIYELSLANIEVIAGKSFIEPYQITDERLNPEVCGMVSSLISVPAEDIWNDYQNVREQIKKQWEDRKNTFEEEYINWFNELKNDSRNVDIVDYDDRLRALEFLYDVNAKELNEYGQYEVTEWRKDGVLWLKTIAYDFDEDIENFRGLKYIFLKPDGISVKEEHDFEIIYHFGVYAGQRRKNRGGGN